MPEPERASAGTTRFQGTAYRTFNDVADRRQERIRSIAEVATKFLDDYKLRNPKSATFAEYAIGHLKRLVGSVMVADVGDTAVAPPHRPHEFDA